VEAKVCQSIIWKLLIFDGSESSALALVSRPEEPLLSASSSETSQKIVDGENSRPETNGGQLPSKARSRRRTFAPFIPAHDLSRGALHAVQALLGYTLMLSVMYVLSIFLGSEIRLAVKLTLFSA
jgi:hypothetical protein